MNSIFSEMRLKNRAIAPDISSGFRGAVLFAVLMLIICGLACGIPNEVKAGDTTSVLSDIFMTENSIKIKVQGPIEYSIQKPDDPFAAIVELKGASIGRFSEKIASTIPGITEINPVQVETPYPAARLTIQLQSPSEVKAAVVGDTLVLTLEKAADAMPSPVKEESSAKSKDGFARSITDVTFDKDGDAVELIIKADGKLTEPAVFQLEGQVIIEIPGVSLKAALPSKLPFPVRDIKARTEQNRVNFTVAIGDRTNSEVYVLDDEVVVDILNKEKRSAKPVAEKGMELQDKVVNGSKVNLDFQDADIVPILQLLAHDVGGYNIVVHPDVKGKITMKLTNVPWNQAMDIVLKTFNLQMVVEGNIIRIATVKAFQDEKKSVAENKELFGKAEDMSTKVFTVNSANVDKVKELIDRGKILSPRGTISVDVRTRSIIVKDIQSSIDEVQKILDSLDKPTQQVMIEARIVEMRRNFSKDLGVDWGFHAATRNTPGTIGTSTGSAGTTGNLVVPGGVTSNLPSGSASTINVPSAVNLPATNPTSAITFGFLNAAQTLGLNLRLSAAELISATKIISNPKILTLDNQEAIIKSGSKVPVQTQQTAGGTVVTTVTYIDAALKLTVTPQISPNKTIMLKVQVNNDSLGDQTLAGNFIVNTEEATTQVALNDGDTIVIGGILQNTQTKSSSDVPGISKLPILGSLFKEKLNSENGTELLIFITPHIVQ